MSGAYVMLTLAFANAIGSVVSVARVNVTILSGLAFSSSVFLVAIASLTACLTTFKVDSLLFSALMNTGVFAVVPSLKVILLKALFGLANKVGFEVTIK